MPALPPALQSRNFQLFWGAYTLSSFGNQFTTVAMAWQIYSLTGSAMDLGLLGLARGVPQIALVLFGGMLADMFDRRKLLMQLQVAQFFISAVLVGFTIGGYIAPWVLYAASFFLAIITALENPTRVSIVPNLVPRDQLTSAVALSSTIRTVGNIAGPPLAGLFLGVGSVEICYAVTAACFLLMLVALFFIRPLAESTSTKRTVMSWDALLDGLRFVWAHPVILSFMALDFSANLFGTARALFPIFALDILGVGAQGLGILYAASSIGSIVAASTLSTVKEATHTGRLVIFGVAVQALTWIAFAYSPYLWLSAILLALGGMGDTVSQILRTTINQILTPDELRGRISSINSVFVNGGGPLGQFRSGVIAELWGARTSTALGGVVTLGIAVIAAMVPLLWTFQLRQIQPPQEEPKPTPSPARP